MHLSLKKINIFDLLFNVKNITFIHKFIMLSFLSVSLYSQNSIGNLAYITTSIQTWDNNTTSVENLAKIVDGNISFNSDSYISSSNASNKTISFKFNKYYKNPELIFYNHETNTSLIVGSIIKIKKFGVIVATHQITSSTQEIKYKPDANISFNEVEITFSNNNQSFREIEIFADILMPNSEKYINLIDYTNNNARLVEQTTVQHGFNGNYGRNDASNGDHLVTLNTSIGFNWAPQSVLFNDSDINSIYSTKIYTKYGIAWENVGNYPNNIGVLIVDAQKKITASIAAISNMWSYDGQVTQVEIFASTEDTLPAFDDNNKWIKLVDKSNVDQNPLINDSIKMTQYHFSQSVKARWWKVHAYNDGTSIVGAWDPSYSDEELKEEYIEYIELRSFKLFDNSESFIINNKPTSMNEGDTKSFYITLGKKPSSNVVFNITSSNQNEASVTSQLTITPNNWDSTSNIVYVNSINDNLLGDDNTTISVSIDNLSSAIEYRGTNNENFLIDFIDNDIPSIVLSNLTSEINEGSSHTFNINLGSKPSSNVLLNITNSNGSEASIVSNITLTPDNWNTNQHQVTINSIDDFYVRDDNTTITISIASTGDSEYANIANKSFTVNFKNDDEAGYILSNKPNSMHEDTNTSFNVILTSKPLNDVVVDFTSSNTNEASVTPSITFTSNNWNIAQAVNIISINDFEVKNNHSTIISTQVNSSSSSEYTNINSQNFTVNFIDNDVKSINTVLWLKADTNTSTTVDGQVVDTWMDLGINNKQFIKTDNPTYEDDNESMINFNPIIRYDGNDSFVSSSNPNTYKGIFSPLIEYSNTKIYLVSKSKDNNGVNANIYYQNLKGTNNDIFLNISNGSQIEFNLGSNTLTVNENDHTNRVDIWTSASYNGEVEHYHEIRKNGYIKTHVNSSSTFIGDNNSEFYLSKDYKSDIAEIIVVSGNKLPEANQLKSIETYLSFKYGKTLHNSFGNMILSDGSVVYSSDAIYWNNIIALGKDSSTSLDQRISKSIEDAASLTLSLDNDFTKKNSLHADTLENNDYIIFSNNAAQSNTTTTSNVNSTLFSSRISRVWKSKNILNSSKTINMKFDNLPNIASNERYVLLSHTNTNFATNYNILKNSKNGEFLDVPVETNNNGMHYYTIAIQNIDLIISKSNLNIQEGNSEEFKVKLSASIDSNVILNLSKSNDKININKSNLIFTPLNWDVEQTVNISVIDDLIDSNNVSLVTLGIDVNLSDPNIHGVVDKNININIINNDFTPIFTSTNTVSVQENQNLAITLSASDQNENDTLTFSIYGGDSELLNINPISGEVTFKNNPDFETKTTYTFTAKVSDNISLNSQDNITVNITDVIEAIIMDDVNISISENITDNSIIHTLNANTTNPNGIYSYEIISSTNDGLFVINSHTGEIQVKKANEINYENTQYYDLVVRVSNTTLSKDVNIRININDVIEVVNFVIQNPYSTFVDEGVDFISPIAKLSNEAIGQVTYTISGNDVSLFNIDENTGQLSLSAKNYKVQEDSDSNNIYDISINVIDQDGNQANKDISIAIRNVNVAPEISNVSDLIKVTNFSNFDLNFHVNDEDKDDLTLEITNSNPSLLTTSFTNTTTQSFNDYNQSNYNISFSSISNKFGSSIIQIKASDEYDLTSSSNFEIQVPATFDFPNISGDIIELNEDFSDYNITLSNIDFQGEDQASVSISFSNANIVNIVNSNIIVPSSQINTVLTLQSIQDIYGDVNATVTVQTASSTVQKNLQIKINPINDKPTITGTPSNALENIAYSWTPTYFDIDNTDSQLSFFANNLPSWASININTGEITGIPNFTDSGLYEYIELIVSDLNSTSKYIVNIDVRNSNIAPTLESFTFNVDEHSKNGTVIQSVVANDADNDNLTYSIISGNTNNAFAINSSNGEVSVNNSSELNYESTTSYNLTIQASDGNANTSNTLIIDINNIDYTYTISPINLQLDEQSGISKDINIVLDQRPASSVKIDLTYSLTKISINKSTINFTSQNWDIPQVIKVTPVDDFLNIDVNTSIEFIIDDSNSHQEYSTISNKTVNIEMINDDISSFFINNAPESMNENSNSSFYITLGSIPTSSVILDITSSNENEASVTSAIVINPNDWNSTNNSVNITAIDDLLKEDSSATITISINSSSAQEYKHLDSQSFDINILNDDTALDIINNYAFSNTNIVPTLTEYHNIGMSDITNSNINFMNALVDISTNTSMNVNEIRTLSNFVTKEFESIQLDENFIDYDINLNTPSITNINYNVTISNPTLLNTNFENDILILSSNENQNGDATISINMTIGTQMFTKAFSIDVTSVNQAPVFTAETLDELSNTINLISNMIAIPYIINIDATDGDNDNIIYSATSTSDKINISINNETGVLEITSTIHTVGSGIINIQIKDKYNAMTTATIKFNISLPFDEFIDDNNGQTKTLKSNKIDQNSTLDEYNSYIKIDNGEVNEVLIDNNITQISLSSLNIDIQVKDNGYIELSNGSNDVTLNKTGIDIDITNNGNIVLKSPLFNTPSDLSCKYITSIFPSINSITTEQIIQQDGKKDITSTFIMDIPNSTFTISEENTAIHYGEFTNENDKIVKETVMMHCDGSMSINVDIEDLNSSYVAINNQETNITISDDGHINVDTPYYDNSKKIQEKLNISLDSNNGKINTKKTNKSNTADVQYRNYLAGTKLNVINDNLSNIQVSLPNIRHISVSITNENNETRISTMDINTSISNNEINRITTEQTGVITTQINASTINAQINDFLDGKLLSKVIANGKTSKSISQLEGSSVKVNSHNVITAYKNHNTSARSVIQNNGKLYHEIKYDDIISNFTVGLEGANTIISNDSSKNVIVETSINNVKIKTKYNGETIYNVKNDMANTSVKTFINGSKTTLTDDMNLTLNVYNEIKCMYAQVITKQTGQSYSIFRTVDCNNPSNELNTYSTLINNNSFNTNNKITINKNNNDDIVFTISTPLKKDKKLEF